MKASWRADEAEESAQWYVNCDTEENALEEVTALLRFRPHYIEAKEAEDQDRQVSIPVGQARRAPPH